MLSSSSSLSSAFFLPTRLVLREDDLAAGFLAAGDSVFFVARAGVVLVGRLGVEAALLGLLWERERLPRVEATESSAD